VDEAAVAFGWAPGGRGRVVGHWAQEFALFGGFATGLFALVRLAVESLCRGGGASLLAQGKDFDGEFAAFVFDVEHVADANLAGWLCGEIV